MPNQADTFFKFKRERYKNTVLALEAFKRGGEILDALYATPLRDLQVFAGEAGMTTLIGSLAASITTFVFSIFGVIPFLIPIFKKKQVTKLEKLLKQMTDEHIIDKDQYDLDNPKIRQTLEKKLTGYLRQRGFYYVNAEIVPENQASKPRLKLAYSSPILDFLGNGWKENKSKNFVEIVQGLFSQEELAEISLKFKQLSPPLDRTPYSKHSPLPALEAALEKLSLASSEDAKKAAIEMLVKDVLIKEGNTAIKKLRDLAFPENFIDKIALLNQIVGFFRTNGPEETQTETTENPDINYTITLEQSRQAFIEKRNKISWWQTITGSYDRASTTAFNFWLVFYGFDMVTGDSNTNTWSKFNQILAIALTLVISLVQWTLEKLVFWSRKSRKTKTPVENRELQYENEDLQHKVLADFFSEESHQAKRAFLEDATSSKYHLKEAEKTALGARIQEIKSPSTAKINPTVMEMHAERLEKAHHTQGSINKFRKFLDVATNITFHGILFSFIGWFAVVAFTAASGIAIAAAVSNPLSLALFAAGMVLGIAISIYQYKQNKKKLGSKFSAEQEAKIEEYKQLEAQNNAFADLLKKNNITPLTDSAYLAAKANKPVKELEDPHAPNDRTFRRLSLDPKRFNLLKPSSWLTPISKFINRFLVATGKFGSGVLIVRLFIFIILTIAGVATLGPLGLGVALGVGAAWSVMHAIKAHHDKKLGVSKNIIDNIDYHLEKARRDQEILLMQLGDKPIVAPVTVSADRNTVDGTTDSVSDDTSLTTTSSFPNLAEDTHPEHPAWPPAPPSGASPATLTQLVGSSAIHHEPRGQKIAIIHKAPAGNDSTHSPHPAQASTPPAGDSTA